MTEYIKYLAVFGGFTLLWVAIAWFFEGHGEVIGHHGSREQK